MKNELKNEPKTELGYTNVCKEYNFTKLLTIHKELDSDEVIKRKEETNTRIKEEYEKFHTDLISTNQKNQNRALICLIHRFKSKLKSIFNQKVKNIQNADEAFEAIFTESIMSLIKGLQKGSIDGISDGSIDGSSKGRINIDSDTEPILKKIFISQTIDDVIRKDRTYNDKINLRKRIEKEYKDLLDELDPNERTKYLMTLDKQETGQNKEIDPDRISSTIDIDNEPHYEIYEIYEKRELWKSIFLFYKSKANNSRSKCSQIYTLTTGIDFESLVNAEELEEVKLQEEEKMSEQEMAEEIGQNINTFRVTKSNCFRELFQYLEERGHFQKKRK